MKKPVLVYLNLSNLLLNALMLFLSHDCMSLCCVCVIFAIIINDSVRVFT